MDEKDYLTVKQSTGKAQRFYITTGNKNMRLKTVLTPRKKSLDWYSTAAKILLPGNQKVYQKFVSEIICDKGHVTLLYGISIIEE